MSRIDPISAHSRDAFLAEVRRRTPRRLATVDFANIIDTIIEWSAAETHRLVPRAPGDQHTVSFGFRESEDVLWAAYPRHEDGGKIVVLPQLFRRLAEAARVDLLERLHAFAPSVVISGTGLLRFPLHLLTRDESLAGACALLDAAARHARDYRRAAG